MQWIFCMLFVIFILWFFKFFALIRSCILKHCINLYVIFSVLGKFCPFKSGRGRGTPPLLGYMPALSGLTQFLALEYLLKILKNAFYFTFSIFSLLRSFNFWSDKIYDVIDWETNNGNKHFFGM